MYSSKKDLLSPSTRPTLRVAFHLLFKQNLVLGLTCTRLRCLSWPGFVATRLGRPFPSAGVWSAAGGHRGMRPGRWELGILGNMEGRHRNKPCFIQNVSQDNPEILMGQGERAARVLLAAENPYWSSCPTFPPKSLPPWKQQSQQTFWHHRNHLVQGWSKVCAAQIWASSSA